MSTPRSFLFLLASARQHGSTETLARRAASGLPADAAQTWLRLRDLPLPPFQDLRHAGDGGYPPPAGHERTLLEATLAATDVVIASPLYWYSLSADAKLYLDYWSGWLRVPGLAFAERMRGKTLWAVTSFASSDQAAAGPLTETLRRTADYLDLRWGGALLANAHRPGELAADPAAQARHDSFFAAAHASVA